MKPSIQERYEAWRARNPGLIKQFEVYALVAQARGRRVGMKALAERVRWDYTFSVDRVNEPFRFNNDYTSRIARELIALHPELENVIETRGLKSA